MSGRLYCNKCLCKFQIYPPTPVANEKKTLKLLRLDSQANNLLPYIHRKVRVRNDLKRRRASKRIKRQEI